MSVHSNALLNLQLLQGTDRDIAQFAPSTCERLYSAVKRRGFFRLMLALPEAPSALTKFTLATGIPHTLELSVKAMVWLLIPPALLVDVDGNGFL